jgi:DNA-directed RNA polymerase specialized sigma24 family protein
VARSGAPPARARRLPRAAGGAGPVSCDLERALERLPPRYQALLKLRYALGYKPAEVADRLGYQASSIRKVTTRCLARLHRQLQATGYRRK